MNKFRVVERRYGHGGIDYAVEVCLNRDADYWAVHDRGKYHVYRKKADAIAACNGLNGQEIVDTKVVHP